MTSKSEKPLTYKTRVLLEEEQPALSILSNKIKKQKAANKSDKLDLSEFVTENNKVALFAARNLTWTGMGKLYRGYTIVDVELASKWLSHPSVRVATPEEVAKEFNK
jgi:hypothetical protein